MPYTLFEVQQGQWKSQRTVGGSVGCERCSDLAGCQQRAFTGEAIRFSTSDVAIAAIKDGRVQPGKVVVMRGAGVCPTDAVNFRQLTSLSTSTSTDISTHKAT
ncbi:hypothetical protein [Paraburkholderia sp. MM5482-R1]|uniref:hypothetical protein n=1 Tax=unclassified Paraburkholderia TaxID=2615204 RepID=UPI003D222D60